MIDYIIHAAAIGGDVANTYFRRQLRISQKGSHQNLVTEADEAVQAAIVRVLTEFLVADGIPEQEIGFLGEEGLMRGGRHLFIIDPIDGTTNFVSGIEYFGIAIGYAFEGILTAGVIRDPVHGESFVGQRGKGAHRIHADGTRTKLKMVKKPLRECMLSTYIPCERVRRMEIIRTVTKLYPELRGVRALGSATMEERDLLLNRLQIAMHATCGAWDIAAAQVMICEAGGSVSDWSGRDLILDFHDHHRRYHVMMTHPDIRDEAVKIISTSRVSP